MSVPALLRLAPILTAREYQEPELASPVMYDSRSLVPLNRSKGVPVVPNHDESRPIGRWLEFYAADDAGGGRWIWARVKIADPPSWLRVGSGVSFGSRKLSYVDRDGYRLIYRAAVHEITVCSEDFTPVEPRARVWWIGKPEDSSARTDRAPADEVIPGDGTLVRRVYSNAIIAVGGVPVRGSAGNPRRVGRDYVIDRSDGSQVIYHGPDAYREALRDGAV